MSAAESRFSEARLEMLSGSESDPDRHRCGLMIRLQPVSFAVSIAMVFIAPQHAMSSLAVTQASIGVATRRAAGTRAVTADVGTPAA